MADKNYLNYFVKHLLQVQKSNYIKSLKTDKIAKFLKFLNFTLYSPDDKNLAFTLYFLKGRDFNLIDSQSWTFIT